MIASGNTVLLHLPVRGLSLRDGRDAVRRALCGDGWRGESAELIVLAVSEALTNAFEHGSLPGACVEVEVTTSAERVVVSVTDAGRPGSATPVGPRPTPAGSSPRGRGLIIMGALADAIEVRAAGPGTQVRLEFARAPLARLAA